ncbi:MAG: hypothetical protein AABW88_04595 [Nanoarchaeota archaeon]
MNIANLLQPEIYFNHNLATEYDKRENKQASLFLDFLGSELTWTQDPDNISSKIERRAGISFNVTPHNHVVKKRKGGWIWTLHEAKQEEERLEKLLTQITAKNTPTLDEYLNAGEGIVKNLDLPYHRFDTDKVLANMHLSEDQQKIFSVNLHDLVIGNLTEAAMREILLKNKKEFIARSYLFHNSGRSQDEKDIRIFNINGINEETLGVRCQREYEGKYLYSGKRIREQRDKISDYVAFFNHIGHHIFYITGIVKKDFLSKNWLSIRDKMEGFEFPETGNESRLRMDYAGTNPLQFDVPMLNTKLMLRYSPQKFLEMLNNR